MTSGVVDFAAALVMIGNVALTLDNVSANIRIWLVNMGQSTPHTMRILMKS